MTQRIYLWQLGSVIISSLQPSDITHLLILSPTTETQTWSSQLLLSFLAPYSSSHLLRIRYGVTSTIVTWTVCLRLFSCAVVLTDPLLISIISPRSVNSVEAVKMRWKSALRSAGVRITSLTSWWNARMSVLLHLNRTEEHVVQWVLLVCIVNITS